MVSNHVAAAVSPRPLPSTSKGRVPGCAARHAENQLLEPRTVSRVIERDLEERERQRQVEGLLDEACKQVSGRKFGIVAALHHESGSMLFFWTPGTAAPGTRRTTSAS